MVRVQIVLGLITLAPEFPEYDRPGRAAATSSQADPGPDQGSDPKGDSDPNRQPPGSEPPP